MKSPNSRRIRPNKQLCIRIANAKGGKFLDEEYINSKHPHNWQCYFGHQFKKTWDRVNNRHEWCPQCKRRNPEEFVRFCFQELFETQFPKQRPDWLRNVEKYKLELDGFSENKRIAFEYHGEQHYKHISHYHPKKADFDKRQRDDQRKVELCQKEGVVLFIVPYNVEPHNMEDFLRAECEKLGVEPWKQRIDFSIYDYGRDDILQEIGPIVKERGGVVLSTRMGDDGKLRVKLQCEKHDETWEPVVASVKTGRWGCKQCQSEVSKERNLQKRWAKVKSAEKKHGIVCLSEPEKCTSTKAKLLWKCKKDHNFEQSLANIQNRHLCQKCTKKRRITIDDMRTHALKHGGICITEELDKAGKTLVKFRCHNYPEHPEFQKKATYIKNDKKLWCEKCKGGKVQRHSIEYVKKLANDHNCELLSEEYCNNTQVLKWRCIECHFEWDANLRQMQRRSEKNQKWCDSCLSV